VAAQCCSWTEFS
jgi:hypothetical protein